MSGEPQTKHKGRYKYKTLKQPRSIRLLHILPGTAHDPLRCRLQEVSLLEPVQYDALSYHWGPPIFSKSIWIQDATCSLNQASDSELNVTQSLYEALLHIRCEENEIALWADAVCINQNDVNERSAQVPLMSQIYQNASQVRAWLGLEDDNSRLAFDWVTRTHSYALDVWSQTTGLLRDLCDFESRNWSQYAIDVFATNCETWLGATFGRKQETRRYWQRRWIIQELALAAKATIMCGSMCMDWHMLYDMWLFTQNRSTLTRNDELVSWGLRGLVPIALSSMYRREGRESDIRSTLLSASETLATDPRDNLYAVLSLMTSSPHTIVPDYQKSILDVYIEGTVAILTEENLRTLCDTRLVDCKDPVFTHGEYVPSWVVDLGNISTPHSGVLTPSNHYSQMASRIEGAWIAAICCTEPVLRVKGMYCDTISLIGHQIYDYAANCVRQCDKQSEVDHHIELEELLSDIWPNAPNSLLRTIFWDCEDTWARPHDGLTRLLSSGFVIRKEKFYKDAGVSVLTDVSKGVDEALDVDLPLFKRVHQMCRKALIEQALREHPGWTLCRYKSGRLGWAPEAAQSGDYVYILFGCPLPIILRPRVMEASSDTVVGDVHAIIIRHAYVEGVMDGELVTEESEKAALHICLH